MENKNKFWLYLGLGVVAALSFKWFVSPETNMTSKRWSIGANMDEEIQFRRSNHRNEKIAGLSNPRRSTEMVEIVSGTTSAAPKAAPAKDQKLAKAENKAKKKDDKKKKKKKKKPKVIGVPESGTSSPEADEDSEDVATVGGSTTTQEQTQTQGGLAQGQDKTAKSISDWEKILLATPNHKETTRFISLYQTKQVTPEVFYGVVGLMVNDSRTQMRQLGVMALGATPSVESYSMLVTTASREQGAVKTQATGYIEQTYSRPQAIQYLYYAIANTEVASEIKIQALKNLDAIVSGVRTPSSTTGEVPKAPTTNQKNVVEWFRRLLPFITALSSTGGDAELQTLAANLLPRLTAAVGQSQTIPATGTIADNGS